MGDTPAQHWLSSWMSLSNAGLDGPVPLLRGCDAAYLDLGTNRGLKIEELLEAQPGGFLRLFPPAYRGAANRPCALGAEPNPSHAAHLRTIEDAQRAAGRRVTILNAAISNANGEATFWSDLDEQAHEWGSSLLRWNRGMSPRNSSRVRTVSLDWLLRTHLLPQPDPNPSPHPHRSPLTLTAHRSPLTFHPHSHHHPPPSPSPLTAHRSPLTFHQARTCCLRHRGMWWPRWTSRAPSTTLYRLRSRPSAR